MGESRLAIYRYYVDQLAVVIGLPVAEISDTHLIITVLSARLYNIDDGRFTNQLFKRNLIDSIAMLKEMYRCVDVGSAVFGRSESIRRIVYSLARLSQPVPESD